MYVLELTELIKYSIANQNQLTLDVYSQVAETTPPIWETPLVQ